MPDTIKIAHQNITMHRYGTVIVGAGAAGMNCAKKLYEYLEQNGVDSPQDKIAVVTAGVSLGASRMSGSDKQTYYKIGTSPDIADSAESFARSLTAAGCCHGDLAMAEAVGSLRAFYNLVEAGVPFPTDSIGTYIGYKTDHDPYERATSAGPRTSRFMAECLEKIVRGYSIPIFNRREIAELLTTGSGDDKRIVGVITLHRKNLDRENYAINIFYCDNLVLAAGGPGALYKTSVYPLGQTGIHGIAFKAGLAAENLTESQFGLASTQFRWNVSGTYMQVVPRIYSTDAGGGNPREFLTDFFPTMSSMATNIFLKGYQWPLDPQRIENFQSSLIDIAVSNETQKGRRVFMDFLQNPLGNETMAPFSLDDLGDEARVYLQAAGATQRLPIERLELMNPPAIEVYKQHNIDLHSQPLEIAVCAQHNNGGFAVDKWWQSNITRTFVIGEMAGTHGVKRPGGSALNAGQVGAQRAAMFIANSGTCQTSRDHCDRPEVRSQIQSLIDRLDALRSGDSKLKPAEAISQIQQTMTTHAGHLRKAETIENALSEAQALYNDICDAGLKIEDAAGIIAAIQAEHLALASVAYITAIRDALRSGAGSRGSHLVCAGDGIEIHPDITDPDTKQPLRFKPENEELRDVILSTKKDETAKASFTSQTVKPRPAPADKKPFESAWADHRRGKIYQ